MRISIFIKLILLSLISSFLSCSKSGENENNKAKIFKFNIHAGFTSMDPAFAKNLSNIWVINLIYNGLVELDEGMKVVPSIAESWEISEDGKTYTFKLKEGIQFHKSDIFENQTRDVNAEDFVYSFNRIISPKIASTGAWIFNDKVLKNEDGSINDTCFKAIDDRTFKVYLNEPFPAFIQILTMPYAFVVPKEVVEKHGKEFRVNPIGTGPFNYKHYEEGNLLILKKNESYWKKDEKGNTLPYLDAINTSFIEDKKVAFLKFTKNDLHFISGLDETSKGVALTIEGELKEQYKDKFTFEKTPFLNTEYLGFLIDEDKEISKDHPFQNKKVRQAINYAIDRDELINYIRNGVGISAKAGFVPSGLPSYNPQKVVGYDYDPKKAVELLKEAGFGGDKKMPKITLYTQSSSQYNDMAESVQKQLEEIGVEIEISINPFATHQELVSRSEINFFRGSWVADYPDGENFLTLFYSKNFTPQGPNKFHFKNAQFDSIYENAIAATNMEERWKLYNEMDKVVVEEAPVVFLYYDEVVHFTQNNVVGLKADAMNSLKLETVDLK